MQRQLARDVANVVTSLESTGVVITDVAVIDQLKIKNREYARKPAKLLRSEVNKILDGRRYEGSGVTGEASDTEASMKRMRVATGGDGSMPRGLQSPAPSTPREGGDRSIYKEGDSETEKRRKKPPKTPKTKAKVVEPDDDALFGDKFSLPERPKERYSDIGGLESVLRDVSEQIECPITHPELYSHIGVQCPRGVLLHGPSGCGKTLLAHAIGGELGVYFKAVSGPEFVSGMSGESERKLREVFDDAIAHAPAILFIDEIDSIAGKRSAAQRGMDKRIVSQLLTCLDSISFDATEGQAVIVIGACNHPDDLDPSLRRPGRFDREICLGVPDDRARIAILSVLTRQMKLSSDFNIEALARLTPGYVGADLVALAKEAAIIAVNRVFALLFAQHTAATHAVPTPADVSMSADAASLSLSPPEPISQPLVYATLQEWIRNSPALSPSDLEGVMVSFADFVAATKKVQPSALREGFATIPDVAWSDVGALQDVRTELQLGIVDAIRRPDIFMSLGVKPAVGVLLYGPPGCGKTLVAKAIANESRANFISVKGPELLDKYVGESERAVRTVFERARASAPCVVFFDELDALAPKRGNQSSGGSGVTERVVNQLLTELNGVGERGDVFVVAATNRPDIIDSALLRPGRLDKVLYVPLPKATERAQILRTHVRNTPLAADVDIEDVASRCERYSGADLAGLVREAAMTVLRRVTQHSTGCVAPVGDTVSTSSLQVTQADFDAALSRVRPSVSREDELEYERMYSAKSWSKLSK